MTGMARPSTRGVDLTPRDVAILRDLTRFGVLTAAHLGRLHFSHAAHAGVTGALRARDAADSAETEDAKMGAAKIEDLEARDAAAGRAAQARMEVLARAGYVDVRRPIYGGRVVYRATSSGARHSGTGFEPANLALSLITHHLTVADVALALLPLYPGARWITERELRREALRARRSPLPGHREPGGSHPPDGALVLPGVFVAIEVELTPKVGGEYTRILRWYAGALHVSRVVWFCPRAALRERLSVLIRKEGLQDLVWVQPLPPGARADPWG